MAFAASHRAGFLLIGNTAAVACRTASMIGFSKGRDTAFLFLAMTIFARELFSFPVNQFPGTFVQYMVANSASLIRKNAHMKVMGKNCGRPLKMAEYIFVSDTISCRLSLQMTDT
jgi:hypothetical protein